MASVTHIVKIVGSWGFAIAGCVCVVIARELVLPFGVLSIAFSQLPE